MRSAYALVLAVMLALASSPAAAGERHVFDAKLFAAAQTAGKSILVHVTAPWCGECRAQKPIVAELARQPAFEALTIFDVDFDTQKDALRELKVLKQSTLVAFKGSTETARAVGITKREAIEALVKKAL